MSAHLEIQIIAVIVAIACSLPGVFLVLRKMSMMSDAITHTILLGIVLAFFVTKDLSSPLLILGAALMGVFTVFLTEIINSTKLVSEDSSIGIVFPLLFSIAIILISRYADSVHLDTDSVLLGELAFAPFNRMKVFGIDIGAKSIYTMGVILLINIGYIAFFFKELKLVTFDEALAQALGFAPWIIHYSLMSIVSVTAVGAFEAVGSILVIAFMVGPPITAYLLTDDLKKMLFLSAGIGGFNGIVGYQVASYLDVSIAGSMAVITGLVFFLVFIFSPERGLIRTLTRRNRQRKEFKENSLLFHILNHEDSSNMEIENARETIYQHLHWDEGETKKIIDKLEEENKIYIKDKVIRLTKEGRIYTLENYKDISLTI